VKIAKGKAGSPPAPKKAETKKTETKTTKAAPKTAAAKAKKTVSWSGPTPRNSYTDVDQTAAKEAPAKKAAAPKKAAATKAAPKAAATKKTAAAKAAPKTKANVSKVRKSAPVCIHCVKDVATRTDVRPGSCCRGEGPCYPWKDQVRSCHQEHRTFSTSHQSSCYQEEGRSQEGNTQEEGCRLNEVQYDDFFYCYDGRRVL
jgi:hypothetical protein